MNHIHRPNTTSSCLQEETDWLRHRSNNVYIQVHVRTPTTTTPSGNTSVLALAGNRRPGEIGPNTMP